MEESVIDWSTLAAWIDLGISLIGTIISPIITTILTNRHQIKLRDKDIQQKALEKYGDQRFNAINNFISKVGRCLSYADEQSMLGVGEAYHCIYQYVPTDFWSELDEFFCLLTSYKFDVAKERYPIIVHKLSEILKATPPIHL